MRNYVIKLCKRDNCRENGILQSQPNQPIHTHSTLSLSLSFFLNNCDCFVRVYRPVHPSCVSLTVQCYIFGTYICLFLFESVTHKAVQFSKSGLPRISNGIIRFFVAKRAQIKRKLDRGILYDDFECILEIR